MMKRIVCLLLAVALPAILTSPVFAEAPKQHQESISSHPGFMLSHKSHGGVAGSASTTSENWSGYAVTGTNGSYSSVSSAWTQSPLDCAAVSKNAYSAYWVGLDGYSNSTVEQIGTEANCAGNNASYSAWYEMYPSNPYEVSVGLTVNPGDQMSASVVYAPATTQTTVTRGRSRTVTLTPARYTLTLNDVTTKDSFSTILTPRQTYARSSAEVITERPTAMASCRWPTSGPSATLTLWSTVRHSAVCLTLKTSSCRTRTV